MGEFARSTMSASTGTGNNEQELGAGTGVSKESHDEAIGDGVPSESRSIPRTERL